MKGLILSGGRGSRLRPLTYSGAKQLVPVANRPVLFYVVDNLVHAGISNIGVVVSPETGNEVRSALGDGSAFGARFAFITQPEPLGLAHAVSVARPFLGRDDFVMCLGDNLIGSKIRDAVHTFRSTPHLAAFVLLKHVDNPTAFGVAQFDDRGALVRLVEKPETPPSNLALVGIYMFRSTIFDAIAHIKPSRRGELEVTDALSELIARGGQVHFSLVDAWWLDTGKKDDLLLANATVLEHWLVPHVAGYVDEHCRLQGRVAIGKGARVLGSSVEGPAVIGERAQIVDARIGPFTSVGDGAKVVRSAVDGSVIMEDSAIIDVPRLSHALIGKRVIVHPAASGGPLSMVVGDDCLVEISIP